MPDREDSEEADYGQPILHYSRSYTLWHRYNFLGELMDQPKKFVQIPGPLLDDGEKLSPSSELPRERYTIHLMSIFLAARK